MLFLLAGISAPAQTVWQGVVRDAEDNTPLGFCSVGVRGTDRGTVTNEDGVFSISAKSTDTLAFYYLGYKKKRVPVSVLQKDTVVLLRSSANNLQEVTIKYDEERLYKILLACKKQLEDRKAIKSKAYYQLETKINDKPVEVLECYYNAVVKGATIEKFQYKNGRVGVAKYDGRYFASMNTSKAIQNTDLTQESTYLPNTPLQMDLKSMMEQYKLSQLPSDENIYRIAFVPKKNKRLLFKGEIWMDKESSAIMKIEMSCDSATVHPFAADGLDKLGYVSIYIGQTYQNDEGPGPLHHIDFTYQFDYIDRYKADGKIHSKAPKRARTKGVVYFYDFKRPFIAPYYKYDVSEEDYQKIALLPYNAFFWDNSEGLMRTKEQQRSIDFLTREGQLLNFKAGSNSKVGYEDFVKTNSLAWSDSTRVIITHKNEDLINNPKPYQLKAQIYMDVNRVGDSVHHFSVSVFDVKNTYFTTRLDDKINCFVNIYFDIYEIERLHMEDKLEERSYSVEEVDEIYKRAVKTAERLAAEFVSEAQLGDNYDALKKWNAYVSDNLDIDNIKTFKLNR